MNKRLWLALVDHVTVPGTVPVFIWQENEPSDPLVKRRVDHAPKGELEIVGMFDITHVLQNDPASLAAVRAALQ
jgi:hypothetical protein